MHGLLRAGQAIETVTLKSLEVSLLAAGDGTEIIRHRLKQGGRWALRPEEGWDALEFLLVTSGDLRGTVDGTDISLTAGDTLTHCPVTAPIHFTAHEDTEFIYVSSQPVFHAYSLIVRRMMDLAVGIEQKDGYTVDHCSRITRMAMGVGERMRLSPAQMLRLNHGAFLHDVGKIAVPIEILNKPGKLTDEEWEIMRRHPTAGRNLLEETGLPGLKAAAPIVEQHHERWDGKGYPRGLKGSEILIESTIVSVVDAYDAMTTDRPYHKSMTNEAALLEIARCRGLQFSPDAVDTFQSWYGNMK
jgi:HD-GYP domain-containing protein (c-di-GMP phosphodiesterase class II)